MKSVSSSDESVWSRGGGRIFASEFFGFIATERVFDHVYNE